MPNLDKNDPVAAALVAAIQKGDVDGLRQMLEKDPELSQARVTATGNRGSESRNLLHVATDWPGHFPGVADSIKVLAEFGTDLNAGFGGWHNEKPLHWAASSDDVSAIDALLEAGADIEAPGSIFYNGTAMADATIFAQWNAAKRLVERGARTTFTEAAALGLTDRLEAHLSGNPDVSPDEINPAFWMACHGGQQKAAEYLLNRGAELNWIPHWENLTPLDAAVRNKMTEVVEWLKSKGAISRKGIFH